MSTHPTDPHRGDEDRADMDRADLNAPGWYEIRLGGRLDERWARWFDGMALDTETGGVTILRGRVVDQAALHGLLARLRDVGLPLIAVRRVGEAAVGGTDADPVDGDTTAREPR